jgi:hypothetical protein
MAFLSGFVVEKTAVSFGVGAFDSRRLHLKRSCKLIHKGLQERLFFAFARLPLVCRTMCGLFKARINRIANMSSMPNKPAALLTAGKPGVIPALLSWVSIVLAVISLLIFAVLTVIMWLVFWVNLISLPISAFGIFLALVALIVAKVQGNSKTLPAIAVLLACLAFVIPIAVDALLFKAARTSMNRYYKERDEKMQREQLEKETISEPKALQERLKRIGKSNAPEHKRGEEFNLGEFSFIIKGLRNARALNYKGHVLEPGKGKVFAILTLSAALHGQYNSPVRAYEIKLVDSKGRVYSPDVTPTMASYASEDEYNKIMNEDLKPGETRQVQIAFEIPEESLSPGLMAAIPDMNLSKMDMKLVALID